MEKEVVDFNDRQTTCFSISCLGLFCHAAREFAVEHSAELKRVFTSRGVDIDADFMFDLYHELENCFKNGTKPAKVFLEKLDEAYVNGDMGDFDRAGFQIYDCAGDLGRWSWLYLSSKRGAMAKDILFHVEYEMYKAVCSGLYNVDEPYGPHGEEMMQKLYNSVPYQQAIKDLQHAVDLAKEEKILPFGERKWDYSFLGLPFDPAKGIKDMS